MDANKFWTLQHVIVLSVGFFGHSDNEPVDDEKV